MIGRTPGSDCRGGLAPRWWGIHEASQWRTAEAAAAGETPGWRRQMRKKGEVTDEARMFSLRYLVNSERKEEK